MIWFIVSIPGLPFVGFIIYCYTGKIPVMGANDNLSGTGIAIAIAEYFSKPEKSLKNVEVWVVVLEVKNVEKGAHVHL
jgi:aspartate 1-decarboxylase